MDFSTFSERAHVAVVANAARFAERLGHDLIGIDDLFLGLLVPAEKEYVSTLERIIVVHFGVSRLAFYTAVESITVRSIDSVEAGELYTPSAKQALLDAPIKARQEGHEGLITRTDVMLAVLDSKDAVLKQIFAKTGIDLEQLKLVLTDKSPVLQ